MLLMTIMMARILTTVQSVSIGVNFLILASSESEKRISSKKSKYLYSVIENRGLDDKQSAAFRIISMSFMKKCLKKDGLLFKKRRKYLKKLLGVSSEILKRRQDR